MKEKQSFKLKIADFIFEIYPMNMQTSEFCQDYIAEDDPVPDEIITIKPEDITYEDEQVKEAAMHDGTPYNHFSDLYLERLAIYRKIAEYVSFHNAALFHGALIEKEGIGYIFAARSGTGKTTHIMNWIKVFDDVTVINGDKPILRIKDDGVYAYGTPWCGKEGLNINRSVKLENMIILERAPENTIEPVCYTDYMTQLFNQIYIAQDPYGIKRTLEMIKTFSSAVKLYRLGCNMNPESAITAYEGMNK